MSLRLAFFGTPDFAVPSLRALIEEGFDVATVVTQPDRAKGRHRSDPVPPPIKIAALDDGLDVLQPEQPNSDEFAAELRVLEPDLGVVVGYGHIFKPHMLTLPTRGMINVHASLLPCLRGAAPIEHAIIQGLEETGVSIIELALGLDSGPVIHQVTTPIAPDETGGELTARLAELGALALIEAMTLIATGADERTQQDKTLATHAPKLTHDSARIRWDQPANEIARLVRALDPRIGAWTTLSGRGLKFFGPRWVLEKSADSGTGEVVNIDPLTVSTGSGLIEFAEVQPTGRNRMLAADWLRGSTATVGDRFD